MCFVSMQGVWTHNVDIQNQFCLFLVASSSEQLTITAVTQRNQRLRMIPLGRFGEKQ